MSRIYQFTIFYLLALSVICGCESDYIIQLNGQLSDNNNLIYEINLSLKDSGDVFVEYWAENDSSRFYSVLSTHNINHHLSIFRLLPVTNYFYRVHARSNHKLWVSEIYQFRTDSLPANLPSYELTQRSFDFDGYILLKAFYDPGALILLDQEANIVWYQPYDSSVVRPFEFTYDGKVLSLVDSSVFEETGLDGKLLKRINTRDHGIDKIHHELFKNLLDQYIGLTYTKKIADLSHLGGSKKDTIHADGMVVMDNDGKKIWEWNIFDFVDPLKEDSIMKWKHDWGHANSIAYDRDDNYLISFRNFSQIWKVNSRNGEIIWRLGRKGDFEIQGTDWFISQHDVHLNPEGNLLMFDNGNAKRGYSRVLAFELDEKNFRVHPAWEIVLDPSQTTYRMGSAQMVDKNHVLVCSPKKMLTLSIINTSGETVWKVTGSKDSYKAYYISRERIENKKWF